MSNSDDKDLERQAFTEALQQGHSIIKIENEVQQSLAIMRPRDINQIMTGLKQELQRSPEDAKAIYYSIPYNQKQDDGSNKTVWVEGISIKGSMAIQRHWRNSASACRVVQDLNDRVICEGVFMDYETNNRVMRQVAVSRFYKPKGSTQAVPLRKDKLDIAVASGMSKAVRNAINNAVPEFVKRELFQEAKRLAGATVQQTPQGPKVSRKPLKFRITELLEEYAAFGISKDRIVEFLGKDGLNETDYERLVGLLNALNEGHATPESVFDKPAPSKPAQKPVDLQDLI